MTAQTLIEKCRAADPTAAVFVLVQGRYVRVEDVQFAGVDPIHPPTSVCLKGAVFVPERELGVAREMVAQLRAEAEGYRG